jgi:hypothetical protein
MGVPAGRQLDGAAGREAGTDERVESGLTTFLTVTNRDSGGFACIGECCMAFFANTVEAALRLQRANHFGHSPLVHSYILRVLDNRGVYYPHLHQPGRCAGPSLAYAFTPGPIGFSLQIRPVF